EYEALRDHTSSFSGVAARGRRGASIRNADGTSDLLLVNVVSPNFFSALGVQPGLGRLFAPDDDPARPTIVLSHALWRSRFDRDPGIVRHSRELMRGRPIPVTVAGVLPETFRDLAAASDRDLWLPPQTWALLE